MACRPTRRPPSAPRCDVGLQSLTQAGEPAELRRPAKRAGPLTVFYRNHRRAIRGTYSVLLALFAWELVGRYILTSKLMFAPFTTVMAEFAKLWASGELQNHMLVSFTALAI